MRAEKTTEVLRHEFTREEMAERAQTLAQSYQRLAAAKEEKAASAAQYAERIKSEEALLGKTSREMSQGWETRPIVCKMLWNTPNTGIVSIMREDNEEIVKTRSMTNDELQEKLFVDTQPGLDFEKTTEENIRNFFGMKPDGGTAPADRILAGWILNDWIVVAVTADEASVWLEHQGHKPGEGVWTWADPDTTVIKGLEQIFGTPTIELRRAITHMEHEGYSFPMLLQIPEGYLKALHEGKDPDKAVDEPEAQPETPEAAKARKKAERAAARKAKKEASTDKPTEGAEEEMCEACEVQKAVTANKDGVALCQACYDLEAKDEDQDEDNDLEPEE